jgi:Tfp pilus assembly protein PilV
MRRGFSLVEALVALVLFEVGILALVASGAVVTRDMAIASRRSRATEIAAARIARLRASTCPGPSSGALAYPGGSEHWSVSASGITRTVSDSVEFLLPSGRMSRVVLRAGAVCG